MHSKPLIRFLFKQNCCCWNHFHGLGIANEKELHTLLTSAFFYFSDSAVTLRFYWHYPISELLINAFLKHSDDTLNRWWGPHLRINTLNLIKCNYPESALLWFIFCCCTAVGDWKQQISNKHQQTHHFFNSSC